MIVKIGYIYIRDGYMHKIALTALLSALLSGNALANGWEINCAYTDPKYGKVDGSLTYQLKSSKSISITKTDVIMWGYKLEEEGKQYYVRVGDFGSTGKQGYSNGTQHYFMIFNSHGLISELRNTKDKGIFINTPSGRVFVPLLNFKEVYKKGWGCI